MGRTHTIRDSRGSARRRSRALLLLWLATAALAACGGGGIQPVGGSSGSPGPGGPPSSNTVTLEWVASTGPDLSGYRIYYGTAPGTYSQPAGQGVNVGNVTTHTVTGLGGGATYYFAVTAYNTSNVESVLSNEVFRAFP